MYIIRRGEFYIVPDDLPSFRNEYNTLIKRIFEELKSCFDNSNVDLYSVDCIGFSNRYIDLKTKYNTKYSEKDEEKFKECYKYFNEIGVFSIDTFIECQKLLFMKSDGQKIGDALNENYKTKSNYIKFKYAFSEDKDKIYMIKLYFPLDGVKSDVEGFFDTFCNLSDDKPSEVFAKYILMQFTLCMIHPFDDGNGRIIRCISESYMESKGYLPFVIYSSDIYENYKSYFQEATIKYMNNDRLDMNVSYEYQPTVDAYVCFAEQILNNYAVNTKGLLKKANVVVKESV